MQSKSYPLHHRAAGHVVQRILDLDLDLDLNPDLDLDLDLDAQVDLRVSLSASAQGDLEILQATLHPLPELDKLEH